MKKTLLILALLLSAFTFAQTNGITYQAVIYSATGESVPGIKNNNAPLANKEICLQFSIVDDYSQTEYQEKITVSTDEFGMVNLVIGNGTQTGGYANSFQTIVWNTAKKYLKVGLNQKGNCDYFDEISNQVLSYVPFALAANSATSVSGIVGIANGGTNATTITGAKTNLQLQNVDNTRDLDKPIATITQTALNSKVDKVVGKNLSTEDFTTAEKTKLAEISGVNTGDQDLSSYATTTSTSTALALKVDKVVGKNLSTEDFTTAEKTKLAEISGINTGDQDLSLYATTANLALKAPLASPNFTGIMSLNNRAEFGQNIEREQPSLKLIGFSKSGTGVNSFWPTQPYAGGGLEIGDGGAVRLVIYRKGSNTFNISTTGSLNEGIGINADSYDPAYTLDINGTLGVRNSITSTGTITAGSVTYPNVDGTSGQVLTTNGAGLADWNNPTSISISSINGNSDVNGAVINNGTLSLTPADVTNGGIVTIGSQTFGGNKTFSSDITVNGLTIGKGIGQVNDQNITVGENTLTNNTTGQHLIALGGGTLQNNTTANYNIGIGSSALSGNSTGENNIAIGAAALAFNNGSNNTAIGLSASLLGNSLSNVTGIGYQAGMNNKGSANTFFGANTDQTVASTSVTNSTAIGYGAKISASNQIQLGNTSVTNVKTSGTITAGTITYPNTSGTNGQVLMTNGSGNASWGSVLNFVQKITDMTSSNAIVDSRISIGGVTFQYSLNSGVGGKIQIFTNSTQEYQVLHSKNSGTTGNSFSTPLSNSLPVDLCNQTLTYYDHLSVDFFRVNSGMGNSFHLDAFVDGWGRLVMRITYF